MKSALAVASQAAPIPATAAPTARKTRANVPMNSAMSFLAMRVFNPHRNKFLGPGSVFGDFRPMQVTSNCDSRSRSALCQ